MKNMKAINGKKKEQTKLNKRKKSNLINSILKLVKSKLKIYFVLKKFYEPLPQAESFLSKFPTTLCTVGFLVYLLETWRDLSIFSFKEIKEVFYSYFCKSQKEKAENEDLFSSSIRFKKEPLC